MKLRYRFPSHWPKNSVKWKVSAKVIAKCKIVFIAVNIENQASRMQVTGPVDQPVVNVSDTLG